MPALNSFKTWGINRINVGFPFQLALCTENHRTYVQGAAASFVDTSGNRFRFDGHQYENGMIIRLNMTSGTPPVPITANTDYYVVGVLRDGTGDWYQVATSPGGAAIDITSGPNSGYYYWSLHRSPVTVDATANTFTAFRHPFVNGERVTFENVGGGLPGGITAGTTYYIVNAVAASSFQISTTLGGAAVDITSVGSGTQYVYALPLSEADSAAIWLNREVFSYSTSSRRTWTGTAVTDPLGEDRTVTFTPGGFPVPCRYAFLFFTDSVTAPPAIITEGKWYQDLGSGNVIAIGGRSFTIRDFFPA